MYIYRKSIDQTLPLNPLHGPSKKNILCLVFFTSRVYIYILYTIALVRVSDDLQAHLFTEWDKNKNSMVSSIYLPTWWATFCKNITQQFAPEKDEKGPEKMAHLNKMVYHNPYITR